MWALYKNIHFIFRVMEDPEPVLGTLGARQQSTMNRREVPHRASHTWTQMHTANPPNSMFLGGERIPMWKWGEYVKPHTDSNTSSGLHQGPQSCEVATLPAAPLCH